MVPMRKERLVVHKLGPLALRSPLSYATAAADIFSILSVELFVVTATKVTSPRKYRLAEPLALARASRALGLRSRGCKPYE